MKSYPIPLITALLLFSSTLLAQDDSRSQILLKSGAFIPEKNITANNLDQLNRTMNRVHGKSYAVIQFERIPTNSEKQLLSQAGIELLDYIPNNAYTATITGTPDAQVLTGLNARALLELSPEQKMQPGIGNGIFPAWAVKTAGTIDVWINFPRTFTYEDVAIELRSRNFDIISTLYKEYRVIALRIAQQRLRELASLPFIEYVEPAPAEDRELNNKSRVNSRANVLNASTGIGRNLKGESIVIGVGDNSHPLHVDFTNRIINRAPFGNNFHGTHVHGIGGGAGIWNELYTGYAPKSTLISQGFSGVIINAPSYVTDHRMVITNNSYGVIAGECNYNGLYDQYSRILDQMAANLPNLINVFAAGNSGIGAPYPPCPPYPIPFKTVLGSYQTAKNVLTVGNTYPDGLIFPQSSRGPVQDGRIKPEICAQGSFVVSTATFADYFGNTGTSMATPAVSGGMALLYQRYRALNADADPVNGLMKAILCNTATDKGNTGPDYSYGFGWMNLLRAVQVIETNQYATNTVSNGGMNSFNITVPANTAELKVMLYWTDPAAAAVTNHSLVNDLDLTVTPPSAIPVLPWKLDTLPANVNNPATTGTDHINNIEQVSVNNPVAGTYEVKVNGFSVPVSSPQQYFVVYDIVPISTTLTYPVGGEKLLPGETIVINWDSYGNPANTFNLEYTTNGSVWNIIDAAVAADLRQYTWVVPSTVTEIARVRITRNGSGLPVSTSALFTILGAPSVFLSGIDNQCEGYISIGWSAVSGATDYEVMKLQGTEMVSEAIVPSSSNSYIFSGLSKDSVYWVTVRARFNGFPGRRDTAVFRQPNSGNCQGSISDNDLKLDAIISPASSGRKFTSTELSANVPVTIRIKNLDNTATTGDVSVSYTVNGGLPVNATISSPNIPAGGTVNYTFSPGTIDMSAVGSYIILATATQTGDVVTANNSLTKTFRQLDNPAISGLLTPFLDNFDAAPAQTFTSTQMGLTGLDRYDFTTNSPYGQIRTFVNTGIAYSGTKALTLDTYQYTPVPATDSLTGTYSLAAFNNASDDIRLDFRYKNHGQVVDNGALRVWIRGDDQKNWIQVYNLFANQNPADGSFKFSGSIQLSDSLAANLQNFSTSFQVRWGQWGNFTAADNYNGHGYTFDDVRLYKVTDDLQMVSIDTPIVSSCNLSATTPVRVTIRNNANVAIPAVPGIQVRYRVNGGSWVTEVIPGLAANTSMQYNFSTPANLAAVGTYFLETQVLYTGDTYFDNDTLSIRIVNSPVITSFPHLEDFEAGNGSWYSGGTLNSWEYGTPASYKITRAASGSKAWKTKLAGHYEDLERSYLYSPCFNITGMSIPTLSFSLALDLEDCGAGLCDGAYMEYSRDGLTWTRLGAFGQGTNWYNKNYASNNLWSVKDYQRWHVATIPLPTTGDLTQLRFRFVVTSDASVNRDGVAIDDIHIYDNIYGIYPGPTMTSPVTQTINGGTNWIDFLEGGKLVASVQPNNQTMGSTNAQAYIYTGPSVRISNMQYYHDRNITIIPAPGMENLADSVTVRFYFLDTETERLINASGCGNCTKPSMAYELGVSKYSDTNNNLENGTISDNIQNNWLFITSPNTRKVPFDKGYYAEFKVRNFSEFWLNNGGINNNLSLPVQLLSFTATKKNTQDVLAEWVTASELNVNRFEIEVAQGTADYQQNQFIKAGEVASQGNSTLQQRYQFTDIGNNRSGVYYYRLKIIDNDGSFRYSAIRPVLFTNEVKWQLYPNPSDGIFNLSFQLSEGEELSVKVFDVNGKIIKQSRVLASGFVQKLAIDLEEARYAPGLYLVEASSVNVKQVFKIIKR